MNQKHVGWISLQIPMGLKIKKKKMFGSLVCILLSSSLLKKKKKKGDFIWLTELKKHCHGIYLFFLIFYKSSLKV